MITTRNIADIGTSQVPPTDPGCPLNALLYIPDPVKFPGPYPCYIGTHAPGFDDGDRNLGVFNGVFGVQHPGGDDTLISLAGRGFLCLAFQCRQAKTDSGGGGISGQTTTGRWHQQTDDMDVAIRYMRPGGGIETIQGFTVFRRASDNLSYVGGAGPSGGAHHAMYCAIEGTIGDDKLDAAICCSPPTDFADVDDDASAPFRMKVEQYGDSHDLATLALRSPITTFSGGGGLPNLAQASPILELNGTRENQPYSNLLHFVTAATAAGLTNYIAITNSTPQNQDAHAFAMWPRLGDNGITIGKYCCDWAVDRFAEWSGGQAPPPPDKTGRVRVTAIITGLAPDLPLTLNVRAKDNLSGLEGPTSSFDFISDRADTGGVGKDAPAGVFALVDAVDGVITGDISTRAWLSFSYVNGGCLPTTWGALNPTSRTSFDWSQTDAFMGALLANDKQGGIAVSMGIKDPLWIYSGSHRVSAVNVTGPNHGSVPIPWDPNYLGVIKGFIKEFATKYDTHPNLNYIIVGGMGQLLETLLMQEPADYNNFNNLAVAAGYADAITGWSVTAAGILDIWAKAFRTTAVYLAIELPVPALNGGLMGIDEFTRTSISHYKSRFGMTNLALDGLTAASSDLSLNSIIRDAASHGTPCGYRFKWPSTDPNCDPSQQGAYDAELGLQNAANAGITLGASMEEFYEADILTVTNNYPIHFTAFQSDLLANV